MPSAIIDCTISTGLRGIADRPAAILNAASEGTVTIRPQPQVNCAPADPSDTESDFPQSHETLKSAGRSRTLHAYLVPCVVQIAFRIPCHGLRLSLAAGVGRAHEDTVGRRLECDIG